jgi:hypothetical protein
MLIHDKSPRRAALADQPRPRAQGATDIGGSENVDQAAHPQLGGHKFVRTRFTTNIDCVLDALLAFVEAAR